LERPTPSEIRKTMETEELNVKRENMGWGGVGNKRSSTEC